MTRCLLLDLSHVRRPLPAPGSVVSLPTAAVTEGHSGVQRLHTDILAEDSFLQCSAKYLLGSSELVLVQGQLHILQVAPK